MSDEKNDARVNIEDLAQAEQELTAEEAKDVKGGIGHLLPAIQKVQDAGPATQSGGSNTWSGNIVLDSNSSL